MVTIAESSDAPEVTAVIPGKDKNGRDRSRIVWLALAEPATKKGRDFRRALG
jgi:hypothetical protein